MNDEPIPLEDEIYEEEIEVEEETSVMMAMWGDITGDIDNQTDLKEALDAKQDNLTQAQLDAVNSGINSTKVETYDGYQAQINTKASQSALETEAEARRQADSTLQGNIDAEETARKASDKDIQDVLDGETLARQNADTALGGRIDTEIHDRQVADIGLQGQIDAITSKSDVVDVVATYADLQAYDTQHLGDNDVIKVLDDETHGDALTYYRWSKTNQTWTFIGQEAPYYSKSQTDTLLLGKQNTIDSSHKLSADLVEDTSTTNKFVTAQDITNWNGKQDALTAGTGIDITSGIISTPAIVPEVVTELPTTGAEGKLYLTPKAHTTSTATGNPIEATITAQAGQLESFQLDGDTFQQSYEGKNLLAYPYYNTTKTENGVTFTDNGDGTIQINGTVGTGECLFWITRDIWSYNTANIVVPAGTYTISPTGDQNVYLYITAYGETQGLLGTWNATTASTTFTVSEKASLTVRISVKPSGSVVSNLVAKLQLESGSTATTWEKFVGGQPSPNPDYPQPIQTVTGEQTIRICGLNIYDKSKDLVGYALTGNGVETALPAWHISDYIPVVGGETYTVTGMTTPGGTARTCYYDSAKNLIEAVSQQTSPYTITPPSGSAYVRLSIYNTAQIADSNTLQIELGSTAHDYEAYSGTDYHLDLGTIELCKLGDYQDYIYKDGEDWKVHKAISSITLDGTEDWVYASQYNYARCPNYTFVDIPLSGTGLGVQLSNYFRVITDWGTFRDSTNRNAFFALLNEGYKISIRNTGCTSVEEYKSWLAANNPSFYYPVATPTDTTITDTTLIAQLEAIRTASLENGTNTITNTATGTNLAGDIEIGYYGFNPTNRYDKFIWLDLNNNYEQIGGE